MLKDLYIFFVVHLSHFKSHYNFMAGYRMDSSLNTRKMKFKWNSSLNIHNRDANIGLLIKHWERYVYGIPY